MLLQSCLVYVVTKIVGCSKCFCGILNDVGPMVAQLNGRGGTGRVLSIKHRAKFKEGAAVAVGESKIEVPILAISHSLVKAADRFPCRFLHHHGGRMNAK